MAAFRATLEELEGADVALHVIDITHRNAPEQVQVVDDLLAQLHLVDEASRILVLNKVDLLSDNDLNEGYAQRLRAAINQDRVVIVSAAKKWGMDGLLKAIVEMLDHQGGRKAVARVGETLSVSPQ